MAKIVKFPLKLADGTNARSLEELREHGDVASVLGHYRQGTLARWLKAFGQNELAEQVVEHRNAQVDSSRANLQGIFSLLGIALDEAAFNEYCEKQLSDKFIFSDAVDGGDLKSYGQGVSIKDKLVEFLPQKEFLDDWEVTETPLDGEDVLIEFFCEKLNVSVNFKTKIEDDYKKIAEQLQKQVLVFCPDSNCSQNAKNYKIGDRGPGGGIVFHIEENLAYEVSDDLGEYDWNKAFSVVSNLSFGGYSDWYLPSKHELNLIYENLRKKRIIHDDKEYWSSFFKNGVVWSQRFRDGIQKANYQHREDKHAVRAVRYFRPDKTECSSENVSLPNYKIGDTGPGGGIVFHIEENLAYEVSDDLGEYNWFEAKEKADSYCGGNFNDWRLPTMNEMQYVLSILKKFKKNRGENSMFFTVNWHWSSSQNVYGTTHYACCIDRNTIWGSKLSGTRRIGSTPFGDIRATCGNDYNHYLVRVVRSFSV